MMAGDSDKLKGAEPICVIKIGYQNLEAKEPHKKKKQPHYRSAKVKPITFSLTQTGWFLSALKDDCCLSLWQTSHCELRHIIAISLVPQPP